PRSPAARAAQGVGSSPGIRQGRLSSERPRLSCEPRAASPPITGRTNVSKGRQPAECLRAQRGLEEALAKTGTRFLVGRTAKLRHGTSNRPVRPDGRARLRRSRGDRGEGGLAY